MGTLAGGDGKVAVELLPYHVIGRAADCDLRLSDPSVSAQHASLRWTGEGWQLQDLGSRNGTFVGSRRLSAGERVSIAGGVRIRFGSDPNVFRLANASAPNLIEPSNRLPATVETGGPRCPIAELTLQFAVSRNEEQVDIVVVYGNQGIPLRARAHHYLLLTLARLRLADAEQDPDEPESHGWVDQQSLLDMLAIDKQQLNLSIYRARRQLAEAGVTDSENIVERRLTSRELRIGTPYLIIKVV